MSNWKPIALAVLSLASAGVPAWGQTAAAPPPPAKAAPESQKPDPLRDAFLKLPEAERKAAQDGFVWLGLYNGVVDGAFGKRTGEAIIAFQKNMKATADGVLTEGQLAYLQAAANLAREAVGFAPFDDFSSGARIAAPMKLLEKRSTELGHTKLASRDGAVTLEFYAPKGADFSLEPLYRSLVDEASGRKVVYKALKPDTFFVVSGEDGDSKFYLRYAQGSQGALRGFQFRYPKARTDLDRVALAVADAFDPFPTPGLALTTSPSATPTIHLTQAPAASATPSGPRLIATALVVKPGEALTALRAADCAKPTIGGAGVTYGRADAASGLALLEGEFGANAQPLRIGSDGADAVVLSLALGAAPDRTLLEASESALTPIGEGRVSAVAAVDPAARGAPIFDRQGALVAVLAPLAKPPRRVAGVALAEPHAAIGAEALEAFLGASGAAADSGALSAGEIALKQRSRILAVYCAS